MIGNYEYGDNKTNVNKKKNERCVDVKDLVFFNIFTQFREGVFWDVCYFFLSCFFHFTKLTRNRIKYVSDFTIYRDFGEVSKERVLNIHSQASRSGIFLYLCKEYSNFRQTYSD